MRSARLQPSVRRSPKGSRYIALLLVALAGCSRGQDFALLTQFFSASRLRDLTALQKISTVVFEPAREGIVMGFAIETVTRTGTDAKDVLIAAQVRLPDGRIEQKRFAVKVQRGLVTAISESPAPRSIEGPAASTPPR